MSASSLQSQKSQCFFHTVSLIRIDTDGKVRLSQQESFRVHRMLSHSPCSAYAGDNIHSGGPK